MSINVLKMEFVVPDEAFEPESTEEAVVSHPKPTVHLEEMSEYDVSVSGSTATLVLRGHVEDPIADNVPEGKGADIETVQVYVNDVAAGSPVTVTRVAGEKPPDPEGFWYQHPYKGEFNPIQVSIPVEEGTQVVRLETSENAAGNVGYDEVAVTFTTQTLPGGSTGGGTTVTANIYLPVEPTATVADDLQYYYGEREPLPEDATLSENAGEEDSLVFHGTFSGVDTRVALTDFTGLTAGTDTLTAEITYTYEYGYKTTLVATFTETDVETNLFRVTYTVGGGGAGQPQTTWSVASVSNLGGSGKGVYVPMAVRVKGIEDPAKHVMGFGTSDLDLEEHDGWYYMKGGSIGLAVVVPDPEDPTRLVVMYYDGKTGQLVKAPPLKKEVKATLKNKATLRAIVERTVKVRDPLIAVEGAKTGRVYETYELNILLSPEALQTKDLTPSEMFNAYDTARGYIQVAVVVSPTARTTAQVQSVINSYYNEATAAPSIYDGGAFVVPAFYARYKPAEPVKDPEVGAWRWHARVCIVKPGDYFFYVCAKVKPKDKQELVFPNPNHPADAGEKQKWTYENFFLARLPHGDQGITFAAPAAGARGPVVPATGRYFRRSVLVGNNLSTEPFFALGHCRSWNLRDTDVEPEGQQRWSSAFLPFETEMQRLQAVGGNLFSWWLVSWDSSPVHGMDGADRTEYKEYWDVNPRDGHYQLSPDLNSVADVDGKPYRFLDQGRCKKVDELFDAAEKHGVSIMLTLWPHPDLRKTGTVWDQYSTSARYGPSWNRRVGHWLHGTNEALGVSSNGRFTGWAALTSEPATFVSDWGGASGTYQRNFIRYVVARWGCRRGLGMFELVSELGGTSLAGNDLARISREAAWRSNVSQFIEAVSPYKQLMSSASHSVTWFPDITTGDFVSTHGYCRVNDGTHGNTSMNDDNLGQAGVTKDTDTYRTRVLQEHAQYYNDNAARNKPVFCGEVGACQRRPGTNGGGVADRDLPLALTDAGAATEETKADGQVHWRYRKTVSTYHYTLWTALLSKGAASPLAWCDGKEFGEMKHRPGNSAGGHDRFGQTTYEIDYLKELDACARTLQLLNLEGRLAGMTPTSPTSPTNGLWVFVLKDASNALVWLCLENHSQPKPKVDLSQYGLTWANGDVRWVNPWTGAGIGTAATNQDLTDLDTKMTSVVFSRACAGAGDGSGPHEREDVLLWITKR